jgi:hypothetical protein
MFICDYMHQKGIKLEKLEFLSEGVLDMGFEHCLEVPRLTRTGKLFLAEIKGRRKKQLGVLKNRNRPEH